MSGDSSNDGTLGRIALKQVRVKRSDHEARQRNKGGTSTGPRAARAERPGEPGANPLNRLVPFLDLFVRLSDEELARLAAVELEHVVTMRLQVDEINKMLAPYEDLVERLNEDELVRLTKGTPKTVRFWLLCRPRHGSVSASGVFHQVSAANESNSSTTASGSGKSPEDSSVSLRRPPAASEQDIDISVDSSPGESSGEFDPVFAFEDDEDDDLF